MSKSKRWSTVLLIMNLGIEQGKRVGEILNSLLDEVISGALENEHNALMQRAVELLG